MKPIHDLKLATVVFSQNICKHYVNCIHVDVYVDHNRLPYVFPLKEFNLRKRRCLEFLKNYYMNALYYPSKDNVLVDALSRIPIGILAHVEEERKELEKYVHQLAQLGVGGHVR